MMFGCSAGEASKYDRRPLRSCASIIRTAQLLQVHDLAERSLRIGGIPKRVKDLLDGHRLATAPIDRLPDDAIRLQGGRERLQTAAVQRQRCTNAFAYFLDRLVLA